MTATYTYELALLEKVRSGEVELSQMAEHGQHSDARVRLIDATGTTEIVGQKDFEVDEDACSNPVTWRGFVAARQYMRGKVRQAAGREIDVSLQDENAVLGFRGITGSDRKRPAETVAERGAWIMGSDYLDGLVVDNGRCDFSADKGMDAADYTDQFPGDVFADMALAQGGVNHYVRTFDPYVGREMVFRDDNASTDDTSTIHISNVPGEEDGDTIFYPSLDFTLTRNPERVKSKIAYQYAKGRVVEERTDTADDYNGERFGVASNSNVKTSAKASDEAQAQLWQLHTEEDVLEGSILVPSSHANLLNQGDRIGVRLQHLQNLGGPGITTYYHPSNWIYCRVLEITKRPKLKAAALYELGVRLTPQEAAPPAGAILQKAFLRTTEGGGTITFPNPVTIGSELVVVISARGDTDPDAPNTGASLPRFGAGAWTRFNGSTVTKTWTSGVSGYYKTADSTSQTCKISSANAVVAAFELAGTDCSSATIEDESQTIGGPNYDIGAAQTPAVGDIAIAIWCMGPLPFGWTWDRSGPGGSGSKPWQSTNPPPNLVAGWTLGISKWAFDRWSLAAYVPSEPWSVVAWADGAGASLTARVTPGESGHEFAGLYIVIPPA